MALCRETICCFSFGHRQPGGFYNGCISRSPYRDVAMPRPVVCPKCREELDIPPELRGGDVRCASCATVFTPAVEPDDRPSARGWDESPVQPRRANRATRDRDDSSRDADLDRDFDDRSSSRRRSNAPRKSGMLWLWLMLGGTFGICALGCGRWTAANGTTSGSEPSRLEQMFHQQI